jgi:hypothetical protein
MPARGLVVQGPASQDEAGRSPGSASAKTSRSNRALLGGRDQRHEQRRREPDHHVADLDLLQHVLLGDRGRGIGLLFAAAAVDQRHLVGREVDGDDCERQPTHIEVCLVRTGALLARFLGARALLAQVEQGLVAGRPPGRRAEDRLGPGLSRFERYHEDKGTERDGCQPDRPNDCRSVSLEP